MSFSWGDRFLDVTCIFDPELNNAVKSSMESSVPMTTANVLWANSAKTYADRAELRIAQSLRVPAVISYGMSQALTLHDMKKQFVFIGVVQRNLLGYENIKMEQKKALVEKLIKVLDVELKAPHPEIHH